MLATLHKVHPRAVALSGAVQDVSIHVAQSAYHSDLFIVCCFPDTNVAGLDNYVALKVDLPTSAWTDITYPQPVNPSLWAYVTYVVS